MIEEGVQMEKMRARTIYVVLLVLTVLMMLFTNAVLQHSI